MPWRQNVSSIPKKYSYFFFMFVKFNYRLFEFFDTTKDNGEHRLPTGQSMILVCLIQPMIDIFGFFKVHEFSGSILRQISNWKFPSYNVMFQSSPSLEAQARSKGTIIENVRRADTRPWSLSNIKIAPDMPKSNG